MKLLIRADDFGLSEAVNYGIMKAYSAGTIKNIGLMSNMEAAEHAARLIQGKEVCLGLHVNLTVGKPCAHPSQVSSLLDINGTFLSSKIHREEMERGIDGFPYEETKREVIAQMERFQVLIGRLPDYIDAHAVGSKTMNQAICDAADEYQIKIKGHVSSDAFTTVQKDYTNDSFYAEKQPYINYFTSYLNLNQEKPILLVFHPGYVDEPLLQFSSLTQNRCYDTALLCDEKVKAFLSRQELLSFKEL